MQQQRNHISPFWAGNRRFQARANSNNPQMTLHPQTRENPQTHKSLSTKPTKSEAANPSFCRGVVAAARPLGSHGSRLLPQRRQFPHLQAHPDGARLRGVRGHGKKEGGGGGKGGGGRGGKGGEKGGNRPVSVRKGGERLHSS